MREPQGPEGAIEPAPVRQQGRHPRHPDDEGSEPSLRDLATRFFDDGRTLVRQEIDLAKTEALEAVQEYSTAGVTVAGGVFLALVGVAVLLAFVVIALGALLGGRYWLSTLAVGLLFALVGGLILRRGQARLAANTLRPVHTIGSLRETAAWASRQTDRVDPSMPE